MGFEVRQNWVGVQGLPLARVTLGKLPDRSKPQFSHLQNGVREHSFLQGCGEGPVSSRMEGAPLCAWHSERASDTRALCAGAADVTVNTRR